MHSTFIELKRMKSDSIVYKTSVSIWKHKRLSHGHNNNSNYFYYIYHLLFLEIMLYFKLL